MYFINEFFITEIKRKEELTPTTCSIMKETTHILTKYLPSGNGGAWWVNEKGHAFLSPIIISQLTIAAIKGDKITIHADHTECIEKVFVNGVLAFEKP